MTGEKDRYKTHEQLWKLEDGELSTPKHDELVLQLLNKKNIINLLDALNLGYYEISSFLPTKDKLLESTMESIKSNLGTQERIKKEEIDHLKTYLDAVLDQHIQSNSKFLQNETIIDDTPIIQNIKSEVPIKSGYNNFIVGYIDIQFLVKVSDKSYLNGINTKYTVEFTKNKYEYGYDDNCAYNEIDLGSEKCKYDDELCGIITIYKYLEKYAKHKGNQAWANDEKYITFNIEVKPKIKSFGETLRQINTYREFDHSAIYVIYSPDERFKEAFELQGVKLVTPKDIGINS